MSGNGQITATVEVLAAEVQVLKVGSRQVTLSVYRQLDWAEPEEIEPFGRVRDGQDEKRDRDDGITDVVHVVGRHTKTGALVRSSRQWPMPQAVRLDRLLIVGHDRRDDRMKVDGYLVTVVANKVEQCDGKAVQIFDDNGRLERTGCTRLGDDSAGRAVVSHRSCSCLRFLSPEAEREARRRVWAMRARLAQRRELYEEWEHLPLIVLAGLR